MHCFTIVQLQIFKSCYDCVVNMVGKGMHNTLLVMSHPQTLFSFALLDRKIFSIIAQVQAHISSAGLGSVTADSVLNPASTHAY